MNQSFKAFSAIMIIGLFALINASPTFAASHAMSPHKTFGVSSHIVSPLTSSDDAVGPGITSINGCGVNAYGDPKQSYGGIPGVAAFIMNSRIRSSGCLNAIWDDHNFTNGKTCYIDVYVSASANALITYGVFSSNNTEITSFTLDQNPYWGWHRFTNSNGAYARFSNFHHVQIADNTGINGQFIGTAAMDFTCGV